MVTGNILQEPWCVKKEFLSAEAIKLLCIETHTYMPQNLLIRDIKEETAWGKVANL